MHTRRRRPLKGGDASVRLYRSSSNSTQRSRSQVSGLGLSERQLGLLTQGLRRTLQKQKYKDMLERNGNLCIHTKFPMVNRQTQFMVALTSPGLDDMEEQIVILIVLSPYKKRQINIQERLISIASLLDKEGILHDYKQVKHREPILQMLETILDVPVCA